MLSYTMKILTLHTNYIKFKPVKKALKLAEQLTDKQKQLTEVKNCLVVLTAVESNDDANIARETVKNIKDISKDIKVKDVVLYPYAHLSNKLAKPNEAIKLLTELNKQLSRGGFHVVRAPFGWYKSFDISVKGHPLAELSRDIRIGTDKIKENETEALKAEKKVKSKWYILDKKGKLSEIKSSNDSSNIKCFDFSKHKNLEKFAKYEMKKVRAVNKEPPHVKLMRKLELVDYEPASDPGNLRYYPKGRMIKALIEEWVTKNMQGYAMEVETPIMYDYEHPALKNYLQRFPARQYAIQTPNKKVFLRFAACFGQFIMASQANISYKTLPLRLYELAKYSFRVEQRGELVGLRRLRTFTMPDCHAFCKDIEQAKDEMKLRFMLAKKVQQGFGLDDFELAIRVTKNFFEKNKKFITELVELFGKPALIEMWDKRFFYFVLKYEWNFVDALDKASALTTDQIDVENAKRYGIKYVDKDNKRKDTVILHLSPSGAIERVMYALLEKAYMQEKQSNGKLKSTLPLWLCPTQVRILPLSEKFNKEAIEIANDLNNNENIRTDVDDKNISLSKKILEAEQEWIPYIVILGEKELKDEVLSVRIRNGKNTVMKPIELKKTIKQKTKGMPYRPLPLPMLLSRRPKFVG